MNNFTETEAKNAILEGVAIIDNIDQIQELFDLNTLGLSSVKPTIFTKENCIIVFDVPEYNTMYVLEMVKKFESSFTSKENFVNFFIPQNDEIKDKEFNDVLLASQEIYVGLYNSLILKHKPNLYYCDNLDVIKVLFEPFFQANPNYRLNGDSRIVPAILSVNAQDAGDVFVEVEPLLSTLNYDNILQAYVNCLLIEEI